MMSDTFDSVQDPAQRAEPATGSKRNAAGAARPRSKLTFRIIAGIGIAFVVCYGSWWYIWSLSHERTDDAQVEGHIHAIAARVPGYVAEVAVTDNQMVEAGDVLVRIREDDYRNQVRQAEAVLAQAEADLKVDEHAVDILRGTTTAVIAQAQAAVQQAEAQAESARRASESAAAKLAATEAGREQASAAVEAAAADLERATFEIDRIKQLRLRDSAAADEVNVAQTGYAAAAARLVAAQKLYAAAVAEVEAVGRALDVAKANVLASEAAVATQQAKLEEAGTGPDQVLQAQAKVRLSRAKVAASEAQLEMAKLELDYCTIASPVRGVVSKRSVEVGQYLQPGLPIMAIVPLDTTWVVANFKETQLQAMRAGQSATLGVDAYPDHVFNGVVDSISAGTGARFSILPPENATGNFVKVVQRVPVKIVLQPGERDPQRPMRPGMNVVVTVDTAPPPPRASEP